ncbi:sulfite exporter TauE/SafE family protein [Methylobacterium organophilum]|uniref:sulfite exporter TauE/SafE family protein n=1 Tax=Methylobacterium organophilum TaxID=410 RepID=UPI001F12B27D|nr:sulfite exporter TauE/SafE family protein [Methylobacterium organophilum]UMY16696.1 sulfite exporter TauE/SafE family protein [Methylobacterium organophilum]
MGLLLILLIGLAAGLVSGIIGTGSSIILVPVLASVYGPKEAVPIMAVASVMANVARILAWWRAVEWRAVAAYAVTGAPAAALGARTMLVLPPRAVDTAIGAFLLLMIPARHWLAARLLRLTLWHLAGAGALIGFLTGIVASTGPASVPVFLGYGLTKGPFIGTEAAGSLAVYASKALTFRDAGALPSASLMRGLAVGASLMGGAFLAKPFVLRLAPETFRFVMDGLLLLSGASLLWGGLVRPALP